MSALAVGNAGIKPAEPDSWGARAFIKEADNTEKNKKRG